MSEMTPEEVIARARDLLSSGRDDENLDLLEDAVERFEENPEIRLLYAIALVPFDPERAPWEAATAIKLDPNDPWRLTRAASLMLHLGELDAARSYAARASQIAPPGFPFEPELANLGGKLAAIEGDPALAEEALRAAWKAEPNEESFARDLAEFLAESGRPTDALAVIDEALSAAKQPDKLSALRQRLTQDR